MTAQPSLRLRLGRRYRGIKARLRLALLGTITHVRTEQPLVALTFDDGPHPVYTPPLLDVLARHGARATFFCVGRQVRAHPEIARRIAQDGHTLANHTETHPLFLTLDSAARRQELAACASAIRPYGGVRLFRPPKGHQNQRSRRDILRSGHTPVTWNAHAEDWWNRSAEWMAEKLERELAPGSIVLLHDAIWDPLEPGAEDRSATVAAVDLLLTRLAGRYRWVTVPELLRAGTPVRSNWINPKP